MAIYLREIAQHALLTAEEEVQLAQRLDAGKRAAGALSIVDRTRPEQDRAALEHQVHQAVAARRRLIE